MEGKNTIKGIIFDFNGTLFWDSKLHDKAWNDFALKTGCGGVTAEDLLLRIHGKINKDILTFVLGRKLSDDEADYYSEEKEQIYRNMILSEKEKFSLAPGAEALLDWLKAKEILVNIATSSQKSNVDFYFDYFNLRKWFDVNKIVYENGQLSPKPAPDIFLKAAEKMELKIEDCIILEDSFTGIQAARNTDANKVIFVENDVPVHFSKVKDMVDGRVTDLLEVKGFL